jgi:hypothetical protein
MSKFGLLDDEDPPATPARNPSLSDRIASFPPIRSRGSVDFAAIDAAAAPHGFVSREAAPGAHDNRASGRRRRAIPSEPTRHLAIRLNESAYERFVAYADRYKLTYHEALIRLLEIVGE